MPPSPATPADPPAIIPSRKRWIILILLFLAAVLNYVDRNVLSMLAPTIQADIGIDDQQYSRVLSAFLVAYTIACIFSGRIVDWLGSRLSLALFVSWWSLSHALAAFARGPVSMGFFRSLLGLGEAGGWTASPKAIQEWFPPTERGMGVGVYSMGGSVGAMVAPLIVIPIALATSWHWAFVLTGAVGFAWLIPWLIVNRNPTYADPAPPADRDPGAELVLWKSVFKQRAVWFFMLARMFTDAVWYFYLFWMPKYLHDARGLSQEDLKIMWVVFLMADIGFVFGGILSGRLLKRGMNAPAARLWLMLATALIIPISPLVAIVPSTAIAIAIGSIIAMAHASWLSNITALIVDIIPKRIMATTFGVIAAGSAAGGIFMNELVSWMVRDFSYTPVFFVMALMHPTGIALLWQFRRTSPQI
ncbi:MFS transporter [Luteolibacter sp. Populi]|uniref:MFS transporter n=1 Tax=Luteolibacter sp. Populi TaxID=3230487 RepID=UPI003465C6D5